MVLFEHKSLKKCVSYARKKVSETGKKHLILTSPMDNCETFRVADAGFESLIDVVFAEVDSGFNFTILVSSKFLDEHSIWDIPKRKSNRKPYLKTTP